MRKTKRIEEKPVVDPFSHWEKKEFEVDSVVVIIAEVNGMPKGTKAKVLQRNFDGAAYTVQILDGKKHGDEVRIKACYLS